MVSAKKQTCGQRMSALGRFIYDKESHTVMGRTAKSWALITLFYLIYYTLLAGFFIGMLSVLLYGIIEDTKPLLTGQQSLIRMNPGLGVRPMPDVERTLIRVNNSDPEEMKRFVKNIEDFANTYSTVNRSLESTSMTYRTCQLSDAQANLNTNPLKEICRLNVTSDWGPNCTKENSYGYLTGQPCVIVKLNRIYGWLPNINQSDVFNHTLLRCEPENEGDRATFGNSEVEYNPGVRVNGTSYGYFSSALFPYLKQPGFTTPSVAVRFPSLRRNVLLMVQCRIHNVLDSRFDKVERESMVRFELIILDK